MKRIIPLNLWPGATNVISETTKNYIICRLSRLSHDLMLLQLNECLQQGLLLQLKAKLNRQMFLNKLFIHWFV